MLWWFVKLQEKLSLLFWLESAQWGRHPWRRSVIVQFSKAVMCLLAKSSDKSHWWHACHFESIIQVSPSTLFNTWCVCASSCRWIDHVPRQQCFSLVAYYTLDVSCDGFMWGLFSILSDPDGLAHFRHAAVSTCLSVQHSKAHASSNLSLLCLPCMLMPMLVRWPCLFFYFYSSVSDFLSLDSVTLFSLYRSSLSRALFVLNDADVLDCMCSIFYFSCMQQ